jgi:dephospho-CoA kinase
MMKVIGLTGGIGSGKSTVSQLLHELGAVVLDADRIGHEAYKPNTETWLEVVSAFGRQILTSNGEIDRRRLAQIVFSDPESLARLNQIVHPRMYEMMKTKIEEFRRQGVKVVVLEAAILLEADWTPLVDEVWVTVTPEHEVVKRTVERTGLPEEQVIARIRSQLSSEERTKHANVIINNDGSIDELKVKIKELWDRIQAQDTR